MGVNKLVNVHGSCPWQRQIIIRTPENLELSYLLAGAGSRAAAFLIDSLVMLCAIQVLSNLIMALVLVLAPAGEAYVIALVGLLAFFALNTYFIVFEWLMNGQTPGKKLVGIRVIKQGGYALGFTDTLLRNLLRAVDFLPAFYGVGLVSLILTPNSQRLGDLVTSTVIVHREPIQTDALLPEVLNAPAGENTLPAAQVAQVPSEVVETCVDFFRTVPLLAPRYRQELAAELVVLIQQTSGLACEPTQSTEAFLTELIQQAVRSASWTSFSPDPDRLPS
jgi:uncharacterized RDD family membrane protein YckC